jgi:hypothetical protein
MKKYIKQEYYKKMILFKINKNDTLFTTINYFSTINS